jgi:TRAP-type C4-dicarboxylate transport system permease small subunit
VFFKQERNSIVAKRRSKQPAPERQQAVLMKRRKLLLGVLWLVIIVIAGLIGYSHASPLVAEGQMARGILMGLVYGVGALGLIGAAFFVNRKLRGL